MDTKSLYFFRAFLKKNWACKEHAFHHVKIVDQNAECVKKVTDLIDILVFRVATSIAAAAAVVFRNTQIRNQNK